MKVVVIKKTLSIRERFDEIKLYLKDVINNLKESNTWKTQLAIAIDFELIIHSESENMYLQEKNCNSQF